VTAPETPASGVTSPHGVTAPGETAAVTVGQAQADWWICDGPLPGAQKFLGPFATQELALNVRTYVEKATKRSLWVDDEAPAAPQPAPEVIERIAAWLYVEVSDYDDWSRATERKREYYLDHARELAAILAEHPQEPQPAPELAATKLREGVEQLAKDVTASADATAPSKKSSIEYEVAIQLRKLLETP
jgi:hypothetical protein